MSDQDTVRGRRDVLRTMGAIGTTLAGAGVVSGAPGNGPEFTAVGRKIEQVKIRPEFVEIRTRRVSPALKKRYGYPSGTVSKTERYDRPAASEDDLPMRDTRTKTHDWEAEIATEDEWREAFQQGQNADVSASTAGYSYREEEYAFGLYEYEKVDGLFERTAPMNVISPYRLGGVMDVLTNDEYTDIVVQYNRHAWDSEQNTFRTQDASAATGTFGFLGRKHVKFWEFGGYVSGSAHRDSAVPHEAVSFEDAEQHIEGVFDDAAYWSGYDDYYDIDNGSFLDHDGSATGLF